MSSSIRIRKGSLYLDASLYEAHFRGLNSLAVLRQDERILLLPLQPGSAGGSLVKILNARGDRVIHAHEQLRALGIDDFETHVLAVHWVAELAALAVAPPGLRAATTRVSTGDVSPVVQDSDGLPPG